MREILFRGKRIDNGEWAYGYLFDDDSIYKKRFFVGALVITGAKGTTDAVFDVGANFFEVDPSTIGQYTGLTDKNGVKIFEGDMISYNGSKDVVYFDTSLNIPCFTTGIGRGSSTGPHPYKISKRQVVIGNIHDNPELLK